MTDTPCETAVLDAEDRAVRPALRRGWRRRCPSCGSGPLLRGYLKVRDECPVCGEALHHHRADDGPAYLTILIVGHLMAPLILIAFTAYRPEPLVLAAVVYLLVVLLLGLVLLLVLLLLWSVLISPDCCFTAVASEEPRAPYHFLA